MVRKQDERMPQVEATLQLLDSKQSNGYGNLPIPCAIDDEVHALVAHLVALDPAGRRDLLSRMTQRHGYALLAFAERMAALAVREVRPELVDIGLSAAAISADLVDFRDALMVLSLLYRSAEKLGLDPSAAFAKVESFGNQYFDECIRRFPHRAEADRSIQAMGYVESEDQEGFRYQKTW
jgi:hypothetical protein